MKNMNKFKIIMLTIMVSLCCSFTLPTIAYGEENQTTEEPTLQTLTPNYANTGTATESKKFHNWIFSFQETKTVIVQPVKIAKSGVLSLSLSPDFFKNQYRISLYGDSDLKEHLATYYYDSTKASTPITFKLAKAQTYYIEIESHEANIPTNSVTVTPILYGNSNRQIYANQTICSYSTKEQGAIFYKIVAKGNGILKFSSSDAGVKVQLLNGNKKAISSVSTLRNSQSPTSYTVKKGTYYLKVTSPDVYHFTYQFLGMTVQAGHSIQIAKQISFGRTYKGMGYLLQSTNQADWYKFKLYKYKKVALKFHVSDDAAFRITIYDTNKHPLPSGSFALPVDGSSTLLLKSAAAWKPGTYYIKINKTKQNTSGYYTFWVK